MKRRRGPNEKVNRISDKRQERKTDHRYSMYNFVKNSPSIDSSFILNTYIP